MELNDLPKKWGHGLSPPATPAPPALLSIPRCALDLLKGQLISKCPLGIIVWTKIPTKLFLDFCPEIFFRLPGGFLEAFGASCRLPCLWYYILSAQEAQKAFRKPPGNYKKIQGKNPEIISLVFSLFLSKQ